MRVATLTLLCGLLVAAGIWASAEAGDQAPDFTLRDIKKKNVRLSEVYKEGPVLLTFWSTWCKNCPDEMKHFQRFYDEYKEQGLTVLAVSIDNSKTVSKVRPWIQARRLDYPVLYDTDNKVKRIYHVGPVPHSFVIDQKGQIVYSHVGYRPGDEKTYEKEILKLLKNK